MSKEIEDSLNIIKQVCAAFNGNLEQHSNIQNAIKHLEEKLNE